jgi:hypothetical protein
MRLCFAAFLSATAAAVEINQPELLCSAPAHDASPERTVGGVACCREVYPGFRFPPWEKDYLLELVGASPNGKCVCEGNPANPTKVIVTVGFCFDISSSGGLRAGQLRVADDFCLFLLPLNGVTSNRCSGDRAAVSLLLSQRAHEKKIFVFAARHTGLQCILRALRVLSLGTLLSGQTALTRMYTR